MIWSRWLLVPALPASRSAEGMGHDSGLAAADRTAVMATLSADIERDISGALIGMVDYLRRATGGRDVLSDRLLAGCRAPNDQPPSGAQLRPRGCPRRRTLNAQYQPSQIVTRRR